MKIRENNSGFTLVEMMVSIAAGAILLVAASAMLVTAIRYTGLVYRQASLQQETIGVERVMKIAAQNTDIVSGIGEDSSSLSTSGSFSINSESDTGWVYFKNNSDGKYYIFYLGDGKVCYEVSDDPDTLVVADMTILSENLTAAEVEYTSSDKLSVKLTLADSATSAEPMNACWIF
ncbi:MAG: prepilin-type N-terminal cleavage/methylation domain-containing protein [Lachnospiraceae bacterium]|nr:prepilin-type N-terminal cleavage/methylation domain-containing protein [Lachnospiraceae bacterium]